MYNDPLNLATSKPVYQCTFEEYQYTLPTHSAAISFSILSIPSARAHPQHPQLDFH